MPKHLMGTPFVWGIIGLIWRRICRTAQDRLAEVAELALTHGQSLDWLGESTEPIWLVVSQNSYLRLYHMYFNARIRFRTLVSFRRMSQPQVQWWHVYHWASGVQVSKTTTLVAWREVLVGLRFLEAQLARRVGVGLWEDWCRALQSIVLQMKTASQLRRFAAFGYP